MSRPVRLAGAVGACTVAALIALAAPASAHVTVQPPTATAGGFATLSFNVPNERDNTSTTGLAVQLPTDTPIASVAVQPKAGWTAELTRGKPATPVVTDEGTTVSEVVTEIRWTAEPGNEGIKADEFDTFTISAGPLPEGADELVFKAIQTYSDGEQVRWVEPTEQGQPEPELPAPAVHLVASEGGDDHGGAPESSDTKSGDTPTTAAAETSSDDSTARALGIAGLVTGVAGLAAGGFAIAAARRRPSA